MAFKTHKLSNEEARWHGFNYAFEFDYGDVGTITDGGTADTTIAVLPAGTCIEMVAINPVTALSGGAISAATVSVGPDSSETRYVNAADVFVTTPVRSVTNAEMRTAATTLQARFSVTGAASSALTAGKVVIYLLTRDVNAVTT